MTSASEEQVKIQQLKSTVTSLAVLNRMILETLLRESKREVEFHILNRTVYFINYDRAVIIEFPGKKILGISGTDEPDKQSILYQQLIMLIDGLIDPSSTCVLKETDFAVADVWYKYHTGNPLPEVLWLPLSYSSETNTGWGLWLERWQGKHWQDEEIKAFTPLTTAYGQILKRWSDSHKTLSIIPRIKKHWLLTIICITILMALPLQLRIVAPCEIVPLNPVTVAARTEGVVKKIMVKPGAEVKPGQELVDFEREVAQEEYKAAMQQVRISESDLKRAEVKSLQDKSARESLQLLANNLQQEKTRLDMARKRLDWLRINAPVAGTVLMSDPHEWQGRPVQTGERIMLLVDPHKNKVRIYLPPDDRLDFQTGTEVRVFLNSDSGLSRKASLEYLSQYASISPSGSSSFIADATWQGKQEGAIGGMQGTAIVYGRRVPLLYWLLRKPFGAIRRYMGI